MSSQVNEIEQSSQLMNSIVLLDCANSPPVSSNLGDSTIPLDNATSTHISTFACSSCETTEKICTRILQVVEKNTKQIDNLVYIVNASIADKGEGNQLPILLETDNFPLKTEEDLNNMEQRLNDREEYQKIFSVLKFIGGKDFFDTARRIMSRLISNNLALKVNWTGRNRKPAFKNYINILTLVSELVRENPLSTKATEKEIHGIIKVWLRGAVDRDGGRIKRKSNQLGSGI